MSARKVLRRRMPSVKTLSLVFDDASQARRILLATREQLMEWDAAEERVRECYGRPSTDDIRMHVLSELDPGLFGVECIRVGREGADYLNTGDMYAATLILWRDNFRVQSCGDFIEIMERGGFKRAMSGDF